MRSAERQDADDIARLVNLAFRPERFFVDADRTDPNKVRALLLKGKFLLAEDSQGLAGCVYVEAHAEARVLRLAGSRSVTAEGGVGISPHRRCRAPLPGRRLPLHGLDHCESADGATPVLSALWLRGGWNPAFPLGSASSQPALPPY